MKADDLVKESVRQARQYISYHKQLDIFILLGVLIILLTIPLTVISVNQARSLEARAEAMMSVIPNPVIGRGTEYTVTGSGFTTNEWVSISMADPGCCMAFNLWPSESGSISFNRLTGDPGTYKIDAYQRERNKLVLKATLSFEVIESSKSADINDDGVVNIFDASILASRWGTRDPDADLNGNGVVDIFDASIMASNWDG